MAEDKKGAKHLTSLTLDIEGIKQALEEAKQMIEETSSQLGKEFAENFKQSIEKNNTSFEKLFSQEDAKKVAQSVGKVKAEVSKATEQQNKKELEQIEKMVKAQKKFTQEVEKKKSSHVNKEVIEQSKKYVKSLEEINKEAQKNGKLTDDQREALKGLKQQIKETGETFEESGEKGKSFFRSLYEKASELSTYYAAIKIKEVAEGSIKTLKETEDAVVQLQRVLNENVGQSELSKELYDIAFTYGRSFEDVQEIAVRFAQTGATWAETVALTKSAMLALNTAELDVNQSTEGLIAIMSQWNVEAKDMQSVIDKINITADSFPVTSEKIISALQRASSSAQQAKLSFEETIGAITAMSKATGRSGAVIGTALNSLLIYTSKPKALETFYEVGNDSVRKTVDAYRTGAADILDVWKALSKQLNALGQEQKETLAAQMYEGVGGDDFAQHLEEHAAVITDDIKEIYGTAGTFRQNYLVALLNDIGTIDEVTENMTNAIGYSTSENEKYIGTFSAKLEQLTSLWKGLVVEANNSNAGFMGLAKGVVDLGIGIGTLTKYLGGFNNLLNISVALLLRMKASKVDEKFIKPMSSGFVRLNSKIKEYSAVLSFANIKQKGFKGALIELRSELKKTGNEAGITAAKLSKIQLAIGLGAAAYGGITSVVEKTREKQNEIRDASLAASDATLEQVESTKALYREFVELSSKTNRTGEEQEEFEKKTWELAKALRVETENADGTKKTIEELAAGIRDAKDALTGLTTAEWTERINNLYDVLDQAGKKKGIFGAMYDKEVISQRELTKLTKETRDELMEIMKPLLQREDMDFYYSVLPGGAGKKESYEILAQARDLLKNTYGEGEAGQKVFEALGDAMRDLEEPYKKTLQGLISQKAALENVTEASLGSADAYYKWRESLLSLVDGNESLRWMVYDMADELFPSLSSEVVAASHSFEVTKEEIASLEEEMKDLNSTIDSSQSAFDGVHSAIEEFNNNGYLSVDTIQKLTAGGYDFIKSLDFTSGAIKMTSTATQELVDSQKENVLQSIKLAAAMDLLQYTEDYFKNVTNGTKSETDNLTSGLEGTSKAFADVTIEAFNAAKGANEYARAAANIMREAGPDKIDWGDFEKGLANRYQSWSKYLDFAKKDITSINQFSNKASKNSEKAAREAAAAQKKALEQSKKEINERYKAEKEKLEEQKKAVKERYDAEIDALKEVQKENSRKDKQEEYFKNKKKAEQDIERAASRSGVEYREKEAEAREQLESIKTDWDKVLRDWSVEDRIKSLEKLRDAEIASIEAQIQASEKQKEAELKSIEGRISAIDNQKAHSIDAAKSVSNASVKASKDANKKIAESVEKDAVNPAKKEMYETMKQVSEDIDRVRLNQSRLAEQSAMLNANRILSTYRKGLIIPLSRDLSAINSQIKNIGLNAPLANFNSFSPSGGNRVAPGSQNGSYYSSTTNQTSNIIANINGENAARSLGRNIFTMP